MPSSLCSIYLSQNSIKGDFKCVQFKVSCYLPLPAHVKVVLTINSETAIHCIITLERYVIKRSKKNMDSTKFDRKCESVLATCSINSEIFFYTSHHKMLYFIVKSKYNLRLKIWEKKGES